MTSRTAQRQRRQRRVRKKVTGTPGCPRLSVFRSNRHISAQIIDDEAGGGIIDSNIKAWGNNIENNILVELSSFDSEDFSRARVLRMQLFSK